MKQFIVLTLIALATILVLIFIFNPQLLDQVWLWIIGLIGLIKKSFDKFTDWLKGLFGKEEGPTQTDSNTGTTSPDNKSAPNAPPPGNPPVANQQEIAKLQARIAELEGQLEEEVDEFDGVTFTVLRYVHDENTTLGLFFVNNEFKYYSLEDTYRQVKIPGKTRIPSGTYPVDFYEMETELTKKYRERYSFFKFHIKIYDIPNFKNVYIHVGNYNTDTEGCILIARGISDSDVQKMISNSRAAYAEFYELTKQIKQNNQAIRIKVFDEDWFAQKKIQSSYA